MNVPTLPEKLQVFISEQGYNFDDKGHVKVIKAKRSPSPFKIIMLLLFGLSIIAGGVLLKILYVVGALIIVIPAVSYVFKKRFVYEFDLMKGLFEVRDLLKLQATRAFSFKEISTVSVYHYVADGGTSPFSKSNKEYHFEVVLKLTTQQEFCLFAFCEKEFNPFKLVEAIRVGIMQWVEMQDA